jgi:hypothetical protein
LAGRGPPYLRREQALAGRGHYCKAGSKLGQAEAIIVRPGARAKAIILRQGASFGRQRPSLLGREQALAGKGHHCKAVSKLRQAKAIIVRQGASFDRQSATIVRQRAILQTQSCHSEVGDKQS